MSAPKDICPDADCARGCDEMARERARPNYGPLDEEDEPDVFDLMMGAPDVRDFEPCPPHCPCPYHQRPNDEDA